MAVQHVIKAIFFSAFAIFVVTISAANAAANAKTETKSDGKTISTSKIIANEKAPQGGTFLFNLQFEPVTLNPITSTDAYSWGVRAFICETLMTRNEDTYEFEPWLAEKAEISKDGTEFTFTLRQGVKWSDGKPMTIDDVKFSFDLIHDDKYDTAYMRPYYENIDKAEVTGPNTIKFTTKGKYFGNFDTVASLRIMPKHIYGNPEESKKKNKTMLGSGPYVLKEYNQGQSIILERNKNWWGNSLPDKKGMFNFQTIRMRFDKEENLVLERLKKGELDYDGLTAEAFASKTDGAPWGTTVLKKKVTNLEPKSYGFIGWNMANDKFKDKRVRQALAHLMNREEMNKKFRYGMSLPATGPWYQQSEYANPSVKAFAFDPKKAASLMKEAGWVDSDKDGILDKGSAKFEFTLFYASKDTQKYWVMYQEDLKKAGIVMNLQMLESNALFKNLEEHKFEAVAMGWGGGAVDNNPKQIWHSSSMKGGSNYFGYSNPEVDKLIDTGIAELNKKKRIEIYRKIYAMIADDAPYAFFFNEKFKLFAVNKRIGMPSDTFKFGVGTDYWWMEQIR